MGIDNNICTSVFTAFYMHEDSTKENMMTDHKIGR